MANHQREESASKPPGDEASLTRHGGLSYLEIPAQDPRRSAGFYQNVLGWGIEERGSEDFWFSDTTGRLIGRWVSRRTHSQEPGLLPYFYVNDIRHAIAQVGESGGTVDNGPYPEGNLLVATVRDPTGNLVGLWQANFA